MEQESSRRVTQRAGPSRKTQSGPGRAIPRSTNVVKLQYFHFGIIVFECYKLCCKEEKGQ